MNILFWIYILVGTIFFMIGIILWVKDERKEKRCTEKVIGKIIEIIKYYNTVPELYRLVYEYSVKNKKIVKEFQGTSDRYYKYTIGENIEVYYNPKKYKDSYVKEDVGQTIKWIAFVIIGIAIIFTGIVVGNMK